LNREVVDIIGKKCHAILYNKDDPCTDCFLQEARAFKFGKDFSYSRVLKDSKGTSRDFKISGTALEVRDEEVSSVLLTFSDVSTTVKLNAYLHASATIASLLLRRENIAGLMQHVLEIMGRPAGASRCYWFETSKDASGRLFMSERAEWCATGIEPQIGNPRRQNLAYDDLPRWFEELSCGRVISGPVSGFPDSERSLLESQAVKCILIIPMFIKEDFAGFIGFDNCINEKLWEDAEINLLRSATDSLAKAFEHESVLDDLLKSNARYTDIFANISDFWYLHDMEGRFLEVNPAIEKASGYTKNELLSMSLRDMIPSRYRHLFDDYLEQLMSQGKAEGIIRLMLKNGEEGIFEYRNWLVDLPNGIKASRGLMRDVTQKIKLQAQLKHAQKMESMGTITCGISHDFRNILTAIISKSQLGQLKCENIPEFQKYASEITRLAKTGSDLISELLQFSRKAPRGPMTVTNLVDILDETMFLIGQSFDKKIEIVTDWPKTLCSYGHRGSLCQVFMNLCTNARDAMPNGGILRIEAKRTDNRATITITDTGCGMDEETMEKAFDPFFTTKGPDKGTGLGLPMAYRIVKDHQGQIRVQSELGRGTSFMVSFPLADTVEEIDRKAATEIEYGNGEKILVVDDDETILYSLEELVKGIGYIVKAVNSGQKAIEEYRSWRPDIVLIDRNMPGMDGLNASRKLLSMDSNAKLVLLSGYEAAEADGMDQQLETSIKGYVIKPFDISYLSHVLADVIKQ
jgi:PAS domain S-box-containing protein